MTGHVKIRDFSKLVGKLVSVYPAVRYGLLYVKPLEQIKYLALTNNLKAFMEVRNHSLEIFNRYLSKIPSTCQSIRQPNQGNSSHGYWSAEERKMPINFLKLKAAFFGYKCLARNVRESNFVLHIDNTTAITYINKMGGVRFKHLNELCQEIWHCCETRNLLIHASYIIS